MPEISRFFGIVIRMFYNDHAPPHFHAVFEWALLHRQELRRDWELARHGRAPEPVAPLE